MSRYATRSYHVSHNSTNRPKRIVKRGRDAVAEWRSAALGDVLAAATATAEVARRFADQ